LPVTGQASGELELSLRMLAGEGGGGTARAAPSDPTLELAYSGSGFAVTKDGHILTNNHVVDECREVRVTSRGPAQVLATDPREDFALLRIGGRFRAAATFRRGRGVRLGEEIMVAGYPLQGLLSSDLNITSGVISALSGPGDDRGILQITAPIQGGNSGGPVLDRSGNVVGVVVSSLDPIKFAKVLGDIPQNVNFAISGLSARAFLENYDVPYGLAPSRLDRRSADVAADAPGFTVLVECWK
jgi:S1-C subfamily serine protease